MESTELIADIRQIISQARSLVRTQVNSMQVIANFLIGMRIVNEEQSGLDRAGYGKETLKRLSSTLTKEFGRGYSHRNLEYMRKFYLTYGPSMTSKTSGTSMTSLPPATREESGVSQTLDINAIHGGLSLPEISQTLSAKLPLSWSHYLFLMGIEDNHERRFYEKESAAESWSLRELKRQFDSSLYERLALSRDKAELKSLARDGQLVEKHEDVIKDPYVLEFLGLDEKSRYSESELETAIINKLEHFLLELGKGFLFEARQKRFTFEEAHFHVDLVFYNRLLRCYVLIDLKIGELKHQDLGQMQMYVNYFDRYVKLADEQPTLGSVISTRASFFFLQRIMPTDANIHAAKYQTYLPDKEALKQQLEEAQTEWERRADTP